MFQGCSGVVPGCSALFRWCSGGVPGVPGVFRGVLGCSGMFRVCSGFYRHPLLVDRLKDYNFFSMNEIDSSKGHT